MNVAIINHHLFVNILLVMKNHCYIIQPLQTCEIWIPSPMSNFFAESPKLYKRWQGCSFNHIWKESQTQFYFVCKFLNPYHRKAHLNFLYFLQLLEPTSHSRSERSRTLLQRTPHSVGRSKYDAMLKNVYQWSKKKDEVLIKIWNDRWKDPRADRHEVLKETGEPA